MHSKGLIRSLKKNSKTNLQAPDKQNYTKLIHVSCRRLTFSTVYVIRHLSAFNAVLNYFDEDYLYTRPTGIQQ